MTICPHCHYTNPLGNQFCQDCGVSLLLDIPTDASAATPIPTLVTLGSSREGDRGDSGSPDSVLAGGDNPANSAWSPVIPAINPPTPQHSQIDLPFCYSQATMLPEPTPNQLPPIVSPPFSQGPPTEPAYLEGRDDDSPTMLAPMRLISLESAGSTSIGRQRNHNEDYFEIQTQISSSETPTGRMVEAKALYLLCDGMGGHASGEVASATAVDQLKHYFSPFWAGELPETQNLRAGLLQANRVLFELNEQKSSQGVGRMGTTAAVVLLHNTQIAIAHVGDSRVYRYSRRYGLQQLTVDHEVGQQAILQGVDVETAYSRPEAYQLTQALGPRDAQFVHPDVQFLDLSEDTLLLLCSDGISDHGLLEDYAQSHIEPLLNTKIVLEQGVHQLIDLANEYNGHDNITVIAVRLRVSPTGQVMR